MSRVFPIDLPNVLNRMHECGVGNYWFYHKGSYPNDPPLHYQELLTTATTYIEIWDPHVNIGNGSNDLEIFDNIPTDVTLKILTKKGLVGVNQTFLNCLFAKNTPLKISNAAIILYTDKCSCKNIIAVKAANTGWV